LRESEPETGGNSSTNQNCGILKYMGGKEGLLFNEEYDKANGGEVYYRRGGWINGLEPGEHPLHNTKCGTRITSEKVNDTCYSTGNAMGREGKMRNTVEGSERISRKQASRVRRRIVGAAAGVHIDQSETRHVEAT